MRRIFPLILAVIYAASTSAEERRPARNQLVRVVTISTDRLEGKGGILDCAGLARPTGLRNRIFMRGIER